MQNSFIHSWSWCADFELKLRGFGDGEWQNVKSGFACKDILYSTSPPYIILFLFPAQRARFEIIINSSPFFFCLGVRGRGYRGDIAIDDLSIAMKPSCQQFFGSLPWLGSTVKPITTVAPNNCVLPQVPCVSDGKCISPSQVCDFNLDCADASDERSCRKYD